MGRINFKAQKTSVKKCRTKLVKIPYLTDYYELRLLSGNVVAYGSLAKVSKVRANFEEFSSDPVQLELF